MMAESRVRTPSASPTSEVEVRRWRAGEARSELDELAVEAPLEIRLGKKPITVVMRTPGNDEELVAVLQAGANTLGLYGESQVEAMNQGAEVITVHPGTGNYTIKLPVEKSVDLSNFSLYPVQSPAVSIGGQGTLQIDLTPTGSKGFFRFSAR